MIVYKNLLLKINKKILISTITFFEELSFKEFQLLKILLFKKKSNHLSTCSHCFFLIQKKLSYPADLLIHENLKMK